MPSNWDKFVLLLWKNVIIHKRHPVRTFFEIALPVAICSLVPLIPPDPIVVPEQTYPALSVDRLNDPSLSDPLAYSPKNALLDKLVSDAASSLNISSYKSFDNSIEMENNLINGTFLCGIDFGDSWKTLTTLPESMSFALRFPTQLRVLTPYAAIHEWQTDELTAPFTVQNYNPYGVDGGPPSYWREQFLAVQAAISKRLLANRDPHAHVPPMFVKRFAYPKVVDDTLFDELAGLLPVWIRLTFFYFFINTVKYITLEKEKQLKESIKIMGLPGWVYWSAWFVEVFVMISIPVTVISVIFGVTVFAHSNWFLLWLFLLTYTASIICLCFLMSVFLNKASHAVVLAGVIWTLSFFKLHEDAPFGAKIALSLLTNPAMDHGFDNLIRLEAVHAGLSWRTMFVSTKLNDPYCFGVAIGMLAVNCVIYLCLTLYLEQVMPGKFGVAKRWYFLFTKKFWMNRTTSEQEDQNNELPETSIYFEEDPESVAAGVQIKNLRKVFKGHKVAVDRLNLNLYEGQITVLLGHNGAGKTTTMSMLTGMYSPSSGTALINGFDIRRSMDDVRSSMGLCLQHNVLFDELTVAEHLEFAARLKGVTGDQIRAVVDRYLNLLGLQEKASAQSTMLSGGMKRKLAVGMALCGGPKVVLLDEPTTGIDPTARRALWDLLQQEKQDKTILLSTHFMNEADVLGDRIAILAEGRLTAVGTPFYLKSAFGVGYRLICVKNGQQFNADRLLDLLRKYIPTVEIESENTSEVVIVLRKEFVESFEAMLQSLDALMEYCGIASYGVSLTTLEEVFMKARSHVFLRSHSSTTHREESEVLVEQGRDNVQLIGSELPKQGILQQIRAQVYKKFICTKRAWIQFCWQTFIIPVMFLTFFAFPITFSSDGSLPALELSMNSYSWSLNLVEGSNVSSPAGVKYRDLLDGTQKLDVVEDGMDRFILEKFNQSLLEYNSNLLVGASFDNESYTGWFNSKAYHSAPLALNMIYNSVLRAGCPSCSLTVSNSPVPRKPHGKDDPTNPPSALTSLNIILAIVFTMAYVPAAYITFYIRERTSRMKLLQLISGLKIELYWLTNFLCDMLTYKLCCLVIITSLAIYQANGWSSGEQLGTLLLILFIFGIAVFPMVYLFSLCINNPSTGYSRVLLLNGIGAAFIGLLGYLLNSINAVDLANIVNYCFMLVPCLALFTALFKFSAFIAVKTVCEHSCDGQPGCTPALVCQLRPECCDDSLRLYTFSERGLLGPLIYMLTTGIICSFLVCCIEHNLFHRLWRKLRPVHDFRYAAPLPNIDFDVQNEKNRVFRMTDTDIRAHSVVLRHLTKDYGPISAVKWLSLATSQSECFGLLGINGAGKTTAFKMMIGDETISCGEVWIKGISVQHDLTKAYKHIGYCPQFDALLDELTGMETLRIFALLRGIRGQEVQSSVFALAEQLGFTSYLHKRVLEYSGGNRRKLSTAVALIGSPSVIFLDEPSSGMDPGAKRQLWDVINRLRDAGRTIILTTHSMDECEALCTRLAIMINGDFKCLGSTQHLKNKFSGGFVLFIKMARMHRAEELLQRVAAVKEFVANRFGNAVLKEDLQNSLSYHIPQSDLTWSAMFGIMETSKQLLGIEEYSLGQTTLEQVFLYFTKNNA